MKVGIYGQFYHKNAERSIQHVLDALKRTRVEIWVEKNFLELIKHHEGIDTNVGTFSSFTELDSSYDFFFSIGGDGTILRSITLVRDLGIPIVGINTGKLGFLATIQKQRVGESIEQIFRGEYKISQRSLIAIETSDQQDQIGDLNFALNEIAINRKNSTSMIRVEARINGDHLGTYWSDGLIVATPTGSTGYSLSCGGPILAPDTNNFILTPIAPHNLNVRPFVLPDQSTIELSISGREEHFLLSLDSRTASLSNDTTVSLSKAPFTIKLVQLAEDSFLGTLREKLLWAEDRRN